MKVFRVSVKSNPKSVAAAIAAVLKDESEVHIHAIGAGAVNQAVKAVTIAHGYLAPKGKNIYIMPAFIEAEVNDKKITGINIIVRTK